MRRFQLSLSDDNGIIREEWDVVVLDGDDEKAIETSDDGPVQEAAFGATVLVWPKDESNSRSPIELDTEGLEHDIYAAIRIMREKGEL